MSIVVSVVMLAFGAEPWLGRAVDSVFESEVPDVEVIIVDNGTEVNLEALGASDPRIRVVGAGKNLGFAGGVNFGVSQSRGDVVVLLNSDAELLAGSLGRLVAEASESGAGIVGALIVLADEPNVVNSSGNPLHVLGLSWAGGFGQPTATVPRRAGAASASGACLALSRALWDQLGGFSDTYFAYYEDMDLCWRCHQQGLPVTILSSAKVAHHYEFARNSLKMYLLERNRLLFLLTTHERRTLGVLALPLAAMEAALLVAAVGQGWAGEKLHGWSWLWTERKQVRELRRRVQAARKVADSELLGLLTDSFDTDQLPIPKWTEPMQSVLRAYWRWARRYLADTHSTSQETGQAKSQKVTL